ncbi:hydantoinase/oxoprolinase family protein [Siminovitchia acidinfaciens]|nr:hydantoinase/oxoprolinase family protein [Siminovitchia acidinfaciens]
MYRVGIDVGGTFTDLFAWVGDSGSIGKVRMAKVLSTPEDPVVGFMNALSKAGIAPSEIETVIHGTTIGTNALIERKYPEPAMVTTAGFRDTIEIKRQSRHHLYDPYAVKPSPLISRKQRFTVSEKMGADGSTVKPLNREEGLQVARKIAERGIKNIAICFINSYVSGRHEQEMRDIILEVIPDAKIAVSSETRPKIRELGRFMTTAIRACLFPVVGDYVVRLEKTLQEAGCKAPLFIVKSNGGMMRSQTAKERPEELIESGPAGGVAAGNFIHSMLGLNNMIITDVGGTSFEACLMENGQGLVTDEYELEWEMPLITPMLDIRSIGAGGGSIAWIDEGGSLRVGPQSAGADPGPACYGKGGVSPTVTDANLVLGRLNSTLSGKFQLDYDAAVEAIEKVSEPLGLSVIECAEGIIEIACENMADAIRMVSTDRGRDPRDQTYVSYGGAGGLHAYKVAQSAGINRILIPPFVGVDCSAGATTMNVRHDVEGTFYAALLEVDPAELTKAFEKLEKDCTDMLVNDGVAPEEINLERTALMRYVGQSYEVATPVPNRILDEETLKEIAHEFNNQHKLEYGVYSEDFPIAFVTLRVTGASQAEQPLKDHLGKILGPKGEKASNQISGQRESYFNGKKYLADLYEVDQISKGQKIQGPAFIAHPNSEIVLPPEASAVIDEYGFIHISVNKEAKITMKEAVL